MAGDRKKSPVLFFIGAFIAIAVMVLVVNRKTGLDYEVRFPLNNGVAYLSTLEAICQRFVMTARFMSGIGETCLSIRESSMRSRIRRFCLSQILWYQSGSRTRAKLS